MWGVDREGHVVRVVHPFHVMKAVRQYGRPPGAAVRVVTLRDRIGLFVAWCLWLVDGRWRNERD